MISFDNELINSIEDDIKSVRDVNALRHLRKLINRKIEIESELSVFKLQIGSVIECVRNNKSQGFFRLDKINRTRVQATELNKDLTPIKWNVYNIPFSLVVATDKKVNDKKVNEIKDSNYLVRKDI